MRYPPLVMTHLKDDHPPRRVRAEVIAIEGLSGSGKTTVVRALSRLPGIKTVSEAYDRFPRRPSLYFDTPDELLRLELRLLAEDTRRYTESRRAERSVTQVVTDTDFLGTLTYVRGLATEIDARWNVLAPLLQRARTELERGSWGLADRYLYLTLPPDQALARATGAPTTHPEPLRDRHHRVGLSEREFYLRRLPVLLPDRVESVAATGTAEAIVSEIRRRLLRTAPPTTAQEAGRVLAWFDRTANTPRP
jgi:thymidylate kinase